MPGLVAGTTLFSSLHFNEDVTRIKHLLRNNSLAASDFHNFLGRNEDVVNLAFEVESLHSAPQAFRYLAFKS
jgi:hypothetical protein